MNASDLAAPPALVAPPWMERFSPAERRVACRLGEGLTNKEIALELGRSEVTVRNHVKCILRKTETRTRGRFIVLYQKALAAMGQSRLI